MPRLNPPSEATETLPAGIPIAEAFGLTPREREVLERLVVGETYSQIAARLFISEKTVSSHVSNILRKTGTTSRIELTTMTEAMAASARAGPTRTQYQYPQHRTQRREN
jgi:DNA-binding NarL/FixJ family response regulator